MRDSCRKRAKHLLYLFGPLWRVAECHEYTVGQNRTHDDHAEQREKAGIKERLGILLK